MIEYDNSDGEASSSAEIGVKVIGVGGAGANVLDRMALEGSDDAELVTLNTDVRALSTSVSSDKIQLGTTLLKGMGTGGDPSLGRQAALEAVDEIREAVQGRGMVFVCVGLGGGTGSGAAPEVARIAREEGCFLVAFATLPFSFEGERRMKQATEALDTIGRYANAVITFDNDRMGELIVPKDGVNQAFAAADKIISQSIRATMNIAFRPGIIRIGMDDLLSALQPKDSRCLFGYGASKGDNRSLEAIEQALKCPLLDKGKLLNEADSVLVQVAGGDSMTLFEVQMVMDEVAKHVGSDTQILFGTGTDTRLGNGLSVTIISSISGSDGGTSEVKPEVEEEQISIGMTAAQIPVSPLASAVESAAAEELAEEQQAGAPGEEPDFASEQTMPIQPQEEVVEEEAVEEEEAEAAEQIFEEPEEEDEAPLEPVPADESAIFEPLGEQPAEVEPAYAPEPLPEIIAPRSQEGDELEDDRNPIARAMEAGEDTENDLGHVEATTDTSQKITLSRIVSSGNTGRIQTRDPGEGADGPVLPPSKPPTLPPETLEPEEPSDEAKQQQEMLQLEPVASKKGRFAKTDPTIVDGEDLDVPTFLRKKK